MENDIDQIIITEAEVNARIHEMAMQISNDYQGKHLLVVGVLKGAVLFLSELVRKITIPMEFDFIAVSSYGTSTRSSGVVRMLKDLDEDISGMDILIVEDIIDTGLTLKYLMENISSRHPASLRLCSLLSKPERRKVEITADYVGFEVPDKFVVGFGLDYNEKYRNLPYIGVLKEHIYSS